jgi:hypothetical protein
MDGLTEQPAEKLRLKSAVYQNFSLLCNDKEEYAGYVKCLTCMKIIKHDVHLSGTSHLRNHVASHGATVLSTEGASSQCKMTSFITKKKMLSKADTEELRSTLACFCAADLRPFGVVDGIGFQKMAQHFITIGHKYGNVPVSTILPSRTTVAEQCRSEAATHRKLLVERVNQYIRQHGMIGVTTDMWQDDYKKKNYVSVTVHMMERDKNVARVLQVG